MIPGGKPGRSLGADAVEARRPSQPRGRGQVPVGPEPDRMPVRFGRQRADEGQAEPLPPMIRVNHQLPGDVRPCCARRGVQVGVAHRPAVHGQDQITVQARAFGGSGAFGGPGGGSVVAQVQQHGLGQRRHPVGGPRRLRHRQDTGDLGRGEPAGGDRACSHAQRVMGAGHPAGIVARAPAAGRAPLRCPSSARSPWPRPARSGRSFLPGTKR